MPNMARQEKGTRKKVMWLKSQYAAWEKEKGKFNLLSFRRLAVVSK